ncbi:MAG: peptidoglycan-associated lipoprotein Pal [Candidatus Saccharibacteria bacterium]|nr:peptidoglycan-associated lipoprotein Pal [Rhodoferax sp.]
MRKVFSTVLVCATISWLAGCSSTPVVTPPATAAASPSQPTPPPSVPPKAISQVQPVVVPGYLDPKNPLATNRSVYFDYDVFSVKSEYVPALEMHGKYLSANPKLTIRVEGNTDERGSAEYNLALGQKRADAVVKALKVYGVKEFQLEAVSWGKEKPRAIGQTEVAFAQNRRADLTYPTK